ncbi:VOC family protein [Halobacillus litoralis]|uniref:Glyoxalase/bleomycin resistance/dioxygenase family protein n=1 Tax=Halobacillus litoralis TaxID=45668 RepID=A0A410MIB3_9BACI|nr:VOC family protein [Halobacillus litoralis]QAS54469.1 glyoxalase/bleomycin resistance/dioxygenase family protein [Halobacillus litoralis]
MNFREFGIILFVEHYEDCINFYKNGLRLEVRNVKDTLTTFELPQGYLMVEQEGVGFMYEKNRAQNPVVLRFDVHHLEEQVKVLKQRGIDFSQERLEFDWGTIAVLQDPDGNRIELGEINETSGSYAKDER